MLAFKARSSNGIIRHCVGAIDGFLCKINCPAMNDCDNNPVSCFSGHYFCHGINVQAVCDARCRFIFFAVCAPGSCANQVAIERTNLLEGLERLPVGVFLVGDAAYTLQDRVLVPFTGSQRDQKHKDALNLFLSQLRI